MCLSKKLMILSAIFGLGMCFFSYAFASKPASKDYLSYLVPKDYSVEESPSVPKNQQGYFVPKEASVVKSRSVAKKSSVTKSYPVKKSHSVTKKQPIEKHPVTKTQPIVKKPPVIKSHRVVKRDRVAKRHKMKSRWVVRSYPLAVDYSPIAVSLLVGGGATNIGDNHTIVFSPGSFRTDSFATNDEPIEIAAAIGISYDFHIGRVWERHFLQDITWGVNGYYNQTIVNGAVREYSLADMANSNYDLRLKTGRLMIDTELDFSSPWGTVIPFVELGIGVASNALYFKNSPVPSIDASGGGYVLQDHTQFRFAYEAGVGMKVPLKKQLMLSARYLYANAGQAKTSRSDNESGISLAKPIVVDVSSQSILFGLSYLIG